MRLVFLQLMCFPSRDCYRPTSLQEVQVSLYLVRNALPRLSRAWRWALPHYIVISLFLLMKNNTLIVLIIELA